MTHLILQPVAALMLLTMLVWFVMYARRLRFIIANRIALHEFVSPETLNAVLPEDVNRPSNNLKNLFELPVLFYAICIVIAVAQQADSLSIGLAWAYVALRAIHSAIHCTINIVLLRFTAYVLSSIVLWIMVVRFVSLVY
ncbi:MAG: MAPEG family protein [Burkholderiaceae bacterium]